MEGDDSKNALAIRLIPSMCFIAFGCFLHVLQLYPN